MNQTQNMNTEMNYTKTGENKEAKTDPEVLKNYYNEAKNKINYIEGELEQVKLSFKLAKNTHSMYEKLVYTPNPFLLTDFLDTTNLRSLEKQTNFLLFYLSTLREMYMSSNTKYNVYMQGWAINNIFPAQEDKYNNPSYNNCLDRLQEWLSNVNDKIEAYKSIYQNLKTNTFLPLK